MCTSTTATAEGIYRASDSKLVQFLGCANPWSMCTSIGVDNTSVNIAIRDSLMTRILQRNPAIYFNGCPCHIIHNAAQKAGDAFTECCAFDVEELTIDLYYWFDKSTKRKNGLRSYCIFCDQEYRAIIKHITTRWLSLETAVERTLKQFPSLTSYFKSENESQPRFKRLQKAFSDPLTEVYLLFFQSVLPVFTHDNQLLQREEPLIHILQPQLTKLLKNVLAKFVNPPVIASCLQAGTLSSIDFTNPDNQVSDDKLVIGFIANQKIRHLLEEGDISEHQHTLFFRAARAFLVRATEYLLKWCPFEDELLTNATWLSFEGRLEKSFNSVEYFICRYPELFPGINVDRLAEQFLNYQMLISQDIPTTVKESAGLKPEDAHCIDVLWGYLRGLKTLGTNAFEFDLLFRVAEVIMTIPHSNAGEERIFSMIKKNKTPDRSSLRLDGTLSSLMVVKTHVEDPLKWKPSVTLLDSAKKATKAYNDQHSK